MVKKIKFLFVMMLALVLSNAFVSCDKDSEPNAPKQTKSIDNPELVAKLKALGFQVEGDVLTIDDKVTNVTSLDLSGAKLSNLTGLELFPKLEEVNLSNNNFGDTFDFAGLPKTVKSVNLADNGIYIYKGLATVSDAGFTLQKDLKKLVLPVSARFNVDLLPYYYKETKGKTTLQMQNPETKAIEDYTTLRNIPDETLKEYIETTFPSIMEGEQVDLSKTIKEEVPLILDQPNYNPYYGGPVDITKIKNFEGIEYIINSLSYKGTIAALNAFPENKIKIPYLSPQSSLVMFGVTNIDTYYINWINIENLRIINFENNAGLKVVDLTKSKVFMKSSENSYNNDYMGNKILLYSCSNLEEIKLPKAEEPAIIRAINLIDLPKLKTFDMSPFGGMYQLWLGKLPNTNLTMPVLKHYVSSGGKLDDSNNMSLAFSITEDMANNTKVKEFIDVYKNHLKGWNDIKRPYTPYDYTK